MLFRTRRQSRAAVLERDLSKAGSRAIETIGELAEHAIAAAREAGHAAEPALQRAADTLSEQGDRFARAGEQRAAEAAQVARERIAEASERLAETIRPKKKHHRVRNTLIVVGVIGGVVALVQSPLRAKLTERLFGPPPEEEPESIQLPGSESLSTAEPASATSASSSSIEATPSSTDGAVEGNGVPSAQGGREGQA